MCCRVLECLCVWVFLLLFLECSLCLLLFIYFIVISLEFSHFPSDMCILLLVVETFHIGSYRIRFNFLSFFGFLFSLFVHIPFNFLSFWPSFRLFSLVLYFKIFHKIVFRYLDSLSHRVVLFILSNFSASILLLLRFYFILFTLISYNQNILAICKYIWICLCMCICMTFFFSFCNFLVLFLFVSWFVILPIIVTVVVAL